MTDFIEICIKGAKPGVIGGLNLWHGRQPWFYLDKRKINGAPVPLVSIGLGCAISTAEAVTLPFDVFGQVATAEQIAADVAAISRASFDVRVQDYEAYTICRLGDEGIDLLARRRCEAFAAVLRSLFPEFDEWPVKAQAGALDLIYVVGVHVFFTYYRMIQDLRSGNFAAAALHCNEEVKVIAYEKRNLVRSILFAEAANEAGD